MKTHAEIKKERQQEILYLEQCYTKCKEFLESKGINTKYLHYRNSKFSLEKNKFIADYFCVETHCVKFVESEMVEFYAFSILQDDKIYYGASVEESDLKTTIDLYDWIKDENGNTIGVCKVLNNSKSETNTVFGKFPIELLTEDEIKTNKKQLARCDGFLVDLDNNPIKIIEMNRINLPKIVLPLYRHNV